MRETKIKRVYESVLWLGTLGARGFFDLLKDESLKSFFSCGKENGHVTKVCVGGRPDESTSRLLHRCTLVQLNRRNDISRLRCSKGQRILS